jgi:hypothetical protein
MEMTKMGEFQSCSLFLMQMVNNLAQQKKRQQPKHRLCPSYWNRQLAVAIGVN